MLPWNMSNWGINRMVLALLEKYTCVVDTHTHFTKRKQQNQTHPVAPKLCKGRVGEGKDRQLEGGMWEAFLIPLPRLILLLLLWKGMCRRMLKALRRMISMKKCCHLVLCLDAGWAVEWAGSVGPAMRGLWHGTGTSSASHFVCEFGMAHEHRPVLASHLHISECRVGLGRLLEWPPVMRGGIGK